MGTQTIRKRNVAKQMTLDDFAVKLLRKIIEAPGPTAIERYIAVAVKALGNKNVNGYIIQRFIDRVTRYLNERTLNTPQEEANAERARARLKEFRLAIAKPTTK